MPRSSYKFGPAARRRFLEHLQETGHLGQSATAAGAPTWGDQAESAQFPGKWLCLLVW
jgi:hypothetical protein